MALSSLTLHQFRNHAESRLDGAARFNVIVGENGAGKTNVLEALSLLAPGRGLRRAPLPEMAAQSGDGGFSVSARLASGGVTIGTGIAPEAPGRRIVRINGAQASAQGLGEWLSLIWLTPAMDRLFLESAGGRRRFLDRLALALAPGHARHAARYEAAMRERNRLLAGERAADPLWLDALEARMAEHGAAIAWARRETVERIDALLDNMETGLFAKPGLALAEKGPAEEQALRECLLSERRRDQAAGRTLSGPHRCDLDVVMRQKGQAAAQCSTGEQKAMLISIILAHADLVHQASNSALVLLLDEIAAHLDPARRQALYEQLAMRAGQVWMTGTDSALFDGVPGDLRRDYRIGDGRVMTD
ncbi:MAG: DNA replication/repair protein RecF [Blastomonas sp.]